MVKKAVSETIQPAAVGCRLKGSPWHCTSVLVREKASQGRQTPGNGPGREADIAEGTPCTEARCCETPAP